MKFEVSTILFVLVIGGGTDAFAPSSVQQRTRSNVSLNMAAEEPKRSKRQAALKVRVKRS